MWLVLNFCGQWDEGRLATARERRRAAGTVLQGQLRSLGWAPEV